MRRTRRQDKAGQVFLVQVVVRPAFDQFLDDLHRGRTGDRDDGDVRVTSPQFLQAVQAVSPGELIIEHDEISSHAVKAFEPVLFTLDTRELEFELVHVAQKMGQEAVLETVVLNVQHPNQAPGHARTSES
jgi:hypothetical protein